MKFTGFKKVAALGLTLAMTLAATGPAWAASSLQQVEEIRIIIDTSDITVDSTISAPEVVSGDGAKYYVEGEAAKSVNIDESGKWKAGVVPRFTIRVKPEDGFKFDSSRIKDSAYYVVETRTGGELATFVKASGASNSATITVKLPKLRGDVSNLSVSDLEWSDDLTGRWSVAESAQEYNVKLYKSGSFVKEVTTTNNEYSFGNDITKTGVYSFKVRAAAYGTKGEWDTSDDLEVDQQMLNNKSTSSNNGSNNGTKGTGKGAWLRDNVGWWYVLPDKTFPHDMWRKIDGKWYFFDDKGYMKTGWVQWKNIWYYLDKENGDMWVNRTTPDGYKVNSDGAWVK